MDLVVDRRVLHPARDLVLERVVVGGTRADQQLEKVLDLLLREHLGLLPLSGCSLLEH